jgi:hypothetical protein
MKKSFLVLLFICCSQGLHARQNAPAFTTTYGVTCHNDRLKTGGLSLEKMDLDNIAADAEIWEKVIRT